MRLNPIIRKLIGLKEESLSPEELAHQQQLSDIRNSARRQTELAVEQAKINIQIEKKIQNMRNPKPVGANFLGDMNLRNIDLRNTAKGINNFWILDDSRKKKKDTQK